MVFLINCFKGVFIGAGAILPGISSGVICVIFGIYESLLNCVLNFFKNIKQNFKFLFPIVLGVVVRGLSSWQYIEILILCISYSD